MMNFFRKRERVVLVLILIGIFLIGLFGKFFVLGNNTWIFIFENLLFLPIEVLIMLLGIEKIIYFIDKQNKEIREFRDYYKVGRTSYDKLKNVLENQLFVGYTGLSLGSKVSFEEKRRLLTETDDFLNIDSLLNGVETIEMNMEEVNLFRRRVPLLENVSDHSCFIIEELRNHIQMYSKLLPIDLFDELVSILIFLEENDYYTNRGLSKSFSGNLNKLVVDRKLTKEELLLVIDLNKRYINDYVFLVSKYINLMDDKINIFDK